MATADVEKPAIPPARLVIQKRDDGAIVVRVRSQDTSLPDAVFSFRCGDPQYAHWSRQFEAARTAAE